ncbi:hypothetical protein UM764_10090 [Staphylococcus aureus]|nr:hypothetical protein UM764_10090 [Staphylococcus aureus]
MNMQLNTLGTVLHQTALSPKVKGQLKQKKLIMSGKVLKVMVSNDIERNHFDKACNGSLIKAFRNCGFDIDKIIFETNDNDQEQKLSFFRKHIFKKKTNKVHDWQQRNLKK